MRIDNLSFEYSDKLIYDKFCLDIQEGKTLCVMGSSGSGKTTLLNCISGQLEYDGKILYGQNGSGDVAYVFQQPRLIPSLTVIENIEFVVPKNIRKEYRQKALQLIDSLDLSDCINSYPSKISGGQASRVALARALILEKNILLLDEPFKGLDIKLKTYILNLLKPLISEKTVLFVTHDVEEALAMADRIIVLDRQKGQSVEIFDDIQICDNQQNRDMYGQNINDIRKRLYSTLLK